MHWLRPLCWSSKVFNQQFCAVSSVRTRLSKQRLLHTCCQRIHLTFDATNFNQPWFWNASMWFCGCFRGQLRDDTRLGSDLEPVRVIGKGAAGSVWACRSRTDRTKVVAVKCTGVDAPPWALQMAQRECTTLALLGCSHVNMLKPLQLVLTPECISLVSQYAAGGSLYDYCQDHRLSEDVACYYFRQLVNVIEYMHAGHVAYRDVKLDNLLLTDSTPPRLVLCDFGTSKAFDPSGHGAHMNTFLGTPGFMAPQVLESMFGTHRAQAQQQAHHKQDKVPSRLSSSTAGPGTPVGTARACTTHSSTTCSSTADAGPPPLHRTSYDATKADVWACGAILHYLLLRCLPYGYSEFAHLMSVRESLLTLWQLEHSSWRASVAPRALKKTSPEAQDLLDKLLAPDEDVRITIAAVKQHPWFQRPLPPMYQRSLDLMERQQEQLSRQAAAHPHDGASWCAAVQQVFMLATNAAALQRLAAEHPAEVVLDLDFGTDPVATGQAEGSSQGGRGRQELHHVQQVAARLMLELQALSRATSAALGSAASGSVAAAPADAEVAAPAAATAVVEVQDAEGESDRLLGRKDAGSSAQAVPTSAASGKAAPILGEVSPLVESHPLLPSASLGLELLEQPPAAAGGGSGSPGALKHWQVLSELHLSAAPGWLDGGEADDLPGTPDLVCGRSSMSLLDAEQEQCFATAMSVWP